MKRNIGGGTRFGAVNIDEIRKSIKFLIISKQIINKNRCPPRVMSEKLMRIFDVRYTLLKGQQIVNNKADYNFFNNRDKFLKL